MNKLVVYIMDPQAPIVEIIQNNITVACVRTHIFQSASYC